MPLFKKKQPSNNNNNNGGGGFFSRSPKKQQNSQDQSLQQQAMMYGMSLKNKHDEDVKERIAIEKKMQKQNGGRRGSSQGSRSRATRSKTEDAKTALKVVNFIRKNK
uniref:Uncharacterized protein n=1 Tax=Clytia hemisphaerica TaxID=252671 RepID=A0A7M5VGI7_9CNID